MTKMTSEAHDGWLAEDGPVAVVVRESLIPVDGREGVVFPPTFAASEDRPKGGYNVDDVGTVSAPRKVALMDSVGSQANRIEPLFKRADLRELVPQIVITAGEREVNLLDAGHRAADAIVRCSPLADELADAFKAWQRTGDGVPLARIAPTSLIFGAWDSRDTQAKLPRLLSSTIRAFDVKPLTRSAQYNPALDYVQASLIEAGDRKDLDTLSELGFRHAPAAGTHGGVLVEGEIRRDAVLSLVGIRGVGAPNATEALRLRRYLLGLALVALAAPRTHDLRQGCLLVGDPERPVVTSLVSRDGTREPVTLTFDDVKAYAAMTAHDFGVGKARTVAFESDRARKAMEKKKKENKK